MMRWSAFVASLPAGHADRLVNALTVGWGYTQMAALTAQTNGELALVARYLELAQRHLHEAGRVLNAQVEPGASPEPVLPLRIAGGTSLTWNGFLATLPADWVTALTRALSDAVRDARRIAEAVIEDQEVDWARRRLESALDCLCTARRVVASVPGS